MAQHTFIDRFRPAIVDLKDIGPSARVYGIVTIHLNYSKAERPLSTI